MLWLAYQPTCPMLRVTCMLSAADSMRVVTTSSGGTLCDQHACTAPSLLQALAQLLPDMPDLRGLLLAGNSIGDAGAAALASALLAAPAQGGSSGTAGASDGSSGRVEALDLARNGLTGLSVQRLLPLMQKPRRVSGRRYAAHCLLVDATQQIPAAGGVAKVLTALCHDALRWLSRIMHGGGMQRCRATTGPWLRSPPSSPRNCPSTPPPSPLHCSCQSCDWPATTWATGARHLCWRP